MDASANSAQIPADGRNNPVLVFIHIPKTGGITMEHLMSRQYPSGSTAWLSYQRPEQVEAFMKLTPGERDRLQCVMGHIPFGFHRTLSRPAVHATILREPVARFISEYRYMVRHPREGAWRPPDEAMQTLEAYLDYRIATNAMNVQTSLISGHFPGPGEPPPFAPLPSNALAEAKENLRTQFAVVGVTERFDEALLVLKKRMGWTRRVSYARRNAAPQSSTVEGLAPELVARIREQTRLDAELVEYAESLLTEAVRLEGEAFQRELASLRRRNHMIHRVMHGWKSTPIWKLRNVPGIRQARRVIGTTLARLT